jgi:hypothetical protein
VCAKWSYRSESKEQKVIETADVRRLQALGLSASDINHYTLRQLWDKSAVLRRALLGETSAVKTHWRYEEFAPDVPKPDMTSDDWTQNIRRKVKPVRVNEFGGYLLTTIGAGDLWTGLVTAGLSVPFTSANAMCAVGDGVTAAAVGNTDLAAAAGTKLNASDPTAVTQTGSVPIVITATYSPTPTVGQVVVCSVFAGATAANVNQTWELSAASGAAITLLNSFINAGTVTFAGALVKPINYYRMTVNGAPSHSTNQVVFVSVFGANNANFHAQEWMVCTGGTATNTPATGEANLQNQPPPHVLDRVVADNGTKAQGNTATLTVTATLA